MINIINNNNFIVPKDIVKWTTTTLQECTAAGEVNIVLLTNDEIQKIAQDVSPLLSEFSNDITLNEALFKRVKAVYDSKSDLNLTTEQKTLLDKKYKGFSRNGANLTESKKKKRLRNVRT